MKYYRHIFSILSLICMIIIIFPNLLFANSLTKIPKEAMEYSGNYDFYVVKEIDEETEHLYIPRFILQPVVENSLYHGLPSDLSRQGCIRIHTERVGERLEIIVEDNGEGMSQEELSRILIKNEKDRRSFNGIGVENVNDRIKLFFGPEYGLRYESKKGEYTRCIFRLPAIEEEETWQK